MPASVQLVDFTKVDDQRDPLPIPATFGKNGAMVMSKKQMRNRVRRDKHKKGQNKDFQKLYKPIAEWDIEELARGRPRDRSGGFRGLPPKWITRELHEEAMTRFRQVVRDQMNGLTATALDTIQMILKSSELDDKGRPVVPASVKLQASTWLTEQVVGKPKQKAEVDISVKMQGMLATAVITPDTLPSFPGAKELASPRTDADWDIEDAEEV